MFFSVSQNQIDHYIDESNYEEYECEIVETDYGYMDSNVKIIQIKDESYGSKVGFWETNSKAIENSGFWDDVEVGETVYIFTTEGYFWDGYMRPIVSMRTESKLYLGFAEGKQNQVNELEEMRKDYLARAIPTICISIAGIFLGAVFIVIFAIWQKRSKSENINNLDA